MNFLVRLHLIVLFKKHHISSPITELDKKTLTSERSKRGKNVIFSVLFHSNDQIRHIVCKIVCFVKLILCILIV